MTLIFRWLLRAIICVVIGVWLAAPAMAKVIELRDGETPERILKVFEAFPYEKTNDTWPAGAMEAFERSFPLQRGLDIPANHWVGAELVNKGSDVRELRLNANQVVTQFIGSVFLVRDDGTVEPLIAPSIVSEGAQDRIVPHRIVISPEFRLAPGERVTVLADARLPFSNAMNFRLQDDEAFRKYSVARASSFFLYFGFAIAMTISFLMLALVLRSSASAWYAAFISVTALANFNQQGFIMEAFFPWKEGLFYTFNMAGQVLVALIYLVFINAFIASRTNAPRYFKASIAFTCMLFLSGALAILQSPLSVIGQLASMLWFMVLVGGAAWIAWRQRVDGWRLFALGSLLWILPTPLQSIPGALIADVDINGLGHWVLGLHLIDSLIFGAAIAIQALALRRTRDAAREAEKQAVARQREGEQSRLLAENNRDRARARLAATHHDLRQPLASLRLAMQRVARSENVDDESTKTVQSGLDYIADILAPIADGTPESHNSELDGDAESEVVPVQTLFDNLERMFRAEADAKGLRLVVEPSELSVRAHVLSLIRALSNLLSNAVKYTSEGVITLRAAADEVGVRFVVEDTGQGLDAGTLARIRKRGERDSDAPGGEGLGLAIVEDLAERIGGHLLASSAPGEGSVFSLAGVPRVAR